MKFKSLKSGWKTYATVAVGIGFGVAQAYGVHIPTWVDIILGFAGIGFGRMAISSQAEESTVAIQKLVQDVLTQVSVPDNVQTPVVVNDASRGLTVGQTVVIGKPSPMGQTPAESHAETEALNSAQIPGSNKPSVGG